MKTPPPEPNEESVLSECLGIIQQLQAQPGLGQRALGAAAVDGRLWQLGRARLVAQRAAMEASPMGIGGDVYLATQLYANGGHTALIGDFVRALAQAGGAAPQLLLTDIHSATITPLAEEVCSRLGIPAENITVLKGPSLGERLDQLWTRLLTLRPRRLFLFHHPEDPLSCVVAQPELASQCVLVHHADSTPSLGLQLPGIKLIDLNPIAAAMSRLLGLDPCLLPLTAPDPGPRPAGFLRRGHLVTASSGSQYKFTKPYVYNYAETVTVILQATGGWHVHIGPLNKARLGHIHGVLTEAKLPLDRFVHVPWTASVAAALWEHHCDVYCSSFPIDGARTNVEVFASATPHLRHSTRAEDLLIPGGLVWRTWEELTETLRKLTSLEMLAECSRQMRQHYEYLHAPSVFTKTLHQILAGGPGQVDPHQALRDQRMVASMLKSYTAALTAQAQQLNGLRDQQQSLQAVVAQFVADREVIKQGATWRTRLLRWLTR